MARLRAEPSGLYEVVWGEAWRRGELDLVEHDGIAFDVGTPERLLAANLTAGGGTSFVHPSADVRARLRSSVALPGALVPEQRPVLHGLRPRHPERSCDPEVVAQEIATRRTRRRSGSAWPAPPWRSSGPAAAARLRTASGRARPEAPDENC